MASAMDEWLKLMAAPELRLAIVAGAAAVWGLLAWALGQWFAVARLAKEVRPFYSAIVAAVGIPLGFFAALAIPGLEIRETVLAFAAIGGGGTFVTHKVFGKKAEGTALFKSRGREGGRDLMAP